MAIERVVYSDNLPTLLTTPTVPVDTDGNAPAPIATYYGFESTRAPLKHVPDPLTVIYGAPGDANPGPSMFLGGTGTYTGLINVHHQIPSPPLDYDDSFWFPSGLYLGPTWDYAVAPGYLGPPIGEMHIWIANDYLGGGIPLRVDVQSPRNLFYGADPATSNYYAISYADAWRGADQAEPNLPTNYFFIDLYDTDGDQISAAAMDFERFSWWFTGKATYTFTGWQDYEHVFTSIAYPGITHHSQSSAEVTGATFRAGAPSSGDSLCIPGVGNYSIFCGTGEIFDPRSLDLTSTAPIETTYDISVHFEHAEPIAPEADMGPSRQMFQRGR